MTSRRSRNSAAATATGRGLSPQSLYIYLSLCLVLAGQFKWVSTRASIEYWLAACLVAFNDCILGVMIIYMDSSDSGWFVELVQSILDSA